MITVIVALMTLPCHCWGQVRLSRQEWPNHVTEITSPSLSCTHNTPSDYHSLTLGPRALNEKGESVLSCPGWHWLRWEVNEEKFNGHVPGDIP